MLAEHFLQADPEGRGLSFTPPALAKLQAHDWPGNIRELRHVVEQAVFYAEGEAIAPEQVLLPATGRAATAFLDGQLTMAEIEREAIERRLKHCGGSRRKAAKSLDIAESTLYKKIKDYGL